MSIEQILLFYDKNKSLAWKINSFKDNKLNGYSYYWKSSGNIRSWINYLNGERNGICLYFANYPESYFDIWWILLINKKGNTHGCNIEFIYE